MRLFVSGYVLLAALVLALAVSLLGAPAADAGVVRSRLAELGDDGTSHTAEMPRIYFDVTAGERSDVRIRVEPRAVVLIDRLASPRSRSAIRTRAGLAADRVHMRFDVGLAPHSSGTFDVYDPGVFVTGGDGRDRLELERVEYGTPLPVVVLEGGAATTR